MNLNQINKIRMYQSSNLVLDNFSGLFETSEVLKTKHQVLKDKLSAIGQYRQVQEQATSGLTIEKEQEREELTILMLRISAALVAHAISIDDVDLKKKAHYTPSHLNRSSDPVLHDIGMVLYQLALPLNGQMDMYFVGQAELDALNQKLGQFKAKIPLNRIATSTRKNSTQNIGSLIKETDKLLREEIDALMLPISIRGTGFLSAIQKCPDNCRLFRTKESKWINRLYNTTKGQKGPLLFLKELWKF